MSLLIQFLLRLSFGLATGMAITSSQRVTSGYFRNHLYVTLGLTTLAALLSYSAAPEVFLYAVAATVFSYVGSVCWLYEKAAAGKIVLLAVALSSLTGTFELETSVSTHDFESFFNEYGSLVHVNGIKIEFNDVENVGRVFLIGCDLDKVANVSSGLLLGMTMAAMLLGHWYLNTPTMEMAPLQRLVLALGAAVVFQAALSLMGFWGELFSTGYQGTQWILFLVLRWTFGLLGVAALAWMAWQTLKIPNTQSATGILYVAVIGTFVGETMSLLLSAESLFPL
jgi:hypothetical protein